MRIRIVLGAAFLAIIVAAGLVYWLAWQRRPDYFVDAASLHYDRPSAPVRGGDVMLERAKRWFDSDTALLYVFLAVQGVLLLLSLGGLGLPFLSGTTVEKLYRHPAINALLALVLLAGIVALKATKPNARRANALVFAGFLFGVGAASAFAFDIGVFVAYLLAATSLYRTNAAPATPARPPALRDF
jgi:hypothetical protein